MTSVSCVRWRPKLAGSMETTHFPWKIEGSFQRRRDLGSLLKDKKKYLAKELHRQFETITISSCLARELKAQGNVDEDTRSIIIRGLHFIRKIGEEEEAVKDMLEDAQDRMKHQEDDMWKEPEE